MFTMLPFVRADGSVVAIFYYFAEPANESQQERAVWIPADERKSRATFHRYVATTHPSYLSGQHYQDACLTVA